MKHTPTPWKIREFPHTHTEKENEVCNVRGVIILGGYAAVSCKEDAEHIVRCVNSHDELLEAAKRILKTEDFDIETQHPDCKCSFCCLFKAIAKASLTAGDPTEYVAKATNGDERD